MRLVLLNLDEASPLEDDATRDLVRYLEAFFRVEVQVREVPGLQIAPPGWQALRERVSVPMKSRDGRPGSNAKHQLHELQLLLCLSQLLQTSCSAHGVDTDGAECILAFTSCEFFTSTVGLLPDEPVPEERTVKVSAFSLKEKVGVLSLSRLDFHPSTSAAQQKNDMQQKARSGILNRQFLSTLNHGVRSDRSFMRQLLGFVTHSFLTLLGLRTSQDQMCLSYWKPYDPEKTAFSLTAKSEEDLLRRVRPDAKRDELVELAAARYRDLADVLSDLGARFVEVSLSRRKYREFEEECDWLRVAEEIVTETGDERARLPGTGTRRRSLANCLSQAHEGQPPRTLKRTFTEPFLRRTCLVDMTHSSPYRHEYGEMGKWCHAVFNKGHQAGGQYVELGGSCRPKTVGTFLDCGLNASLVQRPRANLDDANDDMLAATISPGGRVFQSAWNKNHVLAAVAREGALIAKAAPNVREDKDVALLAVSLDKRTLKVLSEQLKGDDMIVKAAANAQTTNAQTTNLPRVRSRSAACSH